MRRAALILGLRMIFLALETCIVYLRKAIDTDLASGAEIAGFKARHGWRSAEHFSVDKDGLMSYIV
jgi:hypothetical protein